MRTLIALSVAVVLIVSLATVYMVRGDEPDTNAAELDAGCVLTTEGPFRADGLYVYGRARVSECDEWHKRDVTVCLQDRSGKDLSCTPRSDIGTRALTSTTCCVDARSVEVRLWAEWVRADGTEEVIVTTYETL